MRRRHWTMTRTPSAQPDQDLLAVVLLHLDQQARGPPSRAPRRSTCRRSFRRRRASRSSRVPSRRRPSPTGASSLARQPHRDADAHQLPVVRVVDEHVQLAGAARAALDSGRPPGARLRSAAAGRDVVDLDQAPGDEAGREDHAAGRSLARMRRIRRLRSPPGNARGAAGGFRRAARLTRQGPSRYHGRELAEGQRLEPRRDPMLDFAVKDTWRIFRIMAEFVEGFETLSQIDRA